MITNCPICGNKLKKIFVEIGDNRKYCCGEHIAVTINPLNNLLVISIWYKGALLYFNLRDSIFCFSEKSTTILLENISLEDYEAFCNDKQKFIDKLYLINELS